MLAQERTTVLVNQYGEVCTKTTAARILGRNVRTIQRMLQDGRIDPACAGSMVDVRSIARYITAPAQADNDARINRVKLRHGSDFAV